MSPFLKKWKWKCNCLNIWHHFKWYKTEYVFIFVSEASYHWNTKPNVVECFHCCSYPSDRKYQICFSKSCHVSIVFCLERHSSSFHIKEVMKVMLTKNIRYFSALVMKLQRISTKIGNHSTLLETKFASLKAVQVLIQ